VTEQKKISPHTWKKGQSGNPAGKKAGSRNKATLAVLALMEAGAKDITQSVVAAAKGGDLTAARMILDRLAPPMRERPIALDLPSTDTAKGISEAQQAILRAVSDGELTPGEASTLSGVVESHRKALETVELEARIAALEERTK
jgi:hypothetical protein